jgi:hypothetical protein
MTLYQQFRQLSTIKKVLFLLVLGSMISLPFGALDRQKARDEIQAQYAAMTPEQRKQAGFSQWCKANPEQCATYQDALVKLKTGR